MPLTTPMGVVEVRALAADVWVVSLRAEGFAEFNLTGTSLSDALQQLAELVAAVEARG